MKPIAALALASFVLAGSACSEGPANAVVPAAGIEPDAAEADVAGTLNLSIPATVNETGSPGGTINLNVGNATDRGGLLIGEEGFGGGDFGEAPSIEIGVEDTTGLALETDPAVPADDVVRLPPPK